MLLGVGVAFKIYYIMAWRRGETDFLQSALTRAVFFSALLTGTAFGSLWISSNPDRTDARIAILKADLRLSSEQAKQRSGLASALHDIAVCEPGEPPAILPDQRSWHHSL